MLPRPVITLVLLLPVSFALPADGQGIRRPATLPPADDSCSAASAAGEEPAACALQLLQSRQQSVRQREAVVAESKPKGLVKALPVRVPNNAVDHERRLVYLLHHKTGCEMSYEHLDALSEYFGEEHPYGAIVGWGFGGWKVDPFMWLKDHPRPRTPYPLYTQVAWAEPWDEENGVGCLEKKAFLFANTLEEQYQKVLRQCPNLRVVHMSRDPVEMLLSGYLYHIGPEGRFDCPPTTCGNWARPLEEGLRVEAASQVKYTLTDMLDIFNETVCDPTVLNLRMDDFEADYDGTSRLVLNHFFDGGLPAADMQKLVRTFAESDIARQAHPQLENFGHIADDGEKARARAKVEEMLAAGDPGIKAVYDIKLKYEEVWQRGCRTNTGRPPAAS